VCCSVLQCVAVCCSVLQCVAVCCSVLQSVAVCCLLLGLVPGMWHDSFICVLQCVAECCSVLQCVAACCLLPGLVHGMWHDSFIGVGYEWVVCGTWLMCVWDMTHLCAGLTRLICDMTHMWYDSYVIWLIYDMTYMWYDSFIRDMTHSYGTWLMCAWDMTHVCVGHDSFVCGTLLIHTWRDSYVIWLICDMTHSYVTWLIHMGHDSCVCGTWTMCVWDMTRLFVGLYSCIRDETRSHVTYIISLWLVGSLKLQVSFAKESYKRDDILQKRPIILLTYVIPFVCI